MMRFLLKQYCFLVCMVDLCQAKIVFEGSGKPYALNLQAEPDPKPSLPHIPCPHVLSLAAQFQPYETLKL